MTRNFATHSTRLTVNADEARTEELHGRTHVVAPVTLVREMVLKGELLPFEEIQRTAMAWNGSPVTVTHPRDEDGGFLPASMDAAEFEAHAVGHIFNTETNPDRRALEGEAWLDAQRSAETAEGLDRNDPAGMLLDGESVEVSTGYWYRKNRDAGTYDDTEYNATQADVQPDHLATLPNGQGECSIEDGCGAGRTAAAAAANGAEGQPPVFAANCPEHGSMDDATLRQRLVALLGLNDTDCECDSALQQEVGDAVRWESDASGSVETSDGTYRYGVVVDGLQDSADDEVKVAVYQPAEDGDGWESRNEDVDIETEDLETVGSDGVESLPAISQLGGESADEQPSTRIVLTTNDDGNTHMTTYDTDDVAEASGLSTETLEAMDDDELTSLAERVLESEDGGDETTENETSDEDGEETANALTAEDVREIVHEAVKGAQNSEEKQRLIDTVRQHSSRDIDADELAGMSVEALEGLAQDVKPTGGVYAGRAGAAGNGGDETSQMGASVDEVFGGDD